MTDVLWSEPFWNALKNNFTFFLVHMLVQNPIGLLLAALLSLPQVTGRSTYRTLIFFPTMLSVVIIGFIWQLILSPLWGVSESLLGYVGLEDWFRPWLGRGGDSAPHLVADLGLAVRRHPDDADLCGPPQHPR